MPSPISIRLPDDLDALVRDRAAQQGATVTEVIVTALRRGLDQPDPVRESLGDLQQRMQGIIERLDAQEPGKARAVAPIPEKPKAPVTYVLEPAGWLGRLKLKPDRSGSSTRS